MNSEACTSVNGFKRGCIVDMSQQRGGRLLCCWGSTADTASCSTHTNEKGVSHFNNTVAQNQTDLSGFKKFPCLSVCLIPRREALPVVSLVSPFQKSTKVALKLFVSQHHCVRSSTQLTEDLSVRSKTGSEQIKAW